MAMLALSVRDVVFRSRPCGFFCFILAVLLNASSPFANANDFEANQPSDAGRIEQWQSSDDLDELDQVRRNRPQRKFDRDRPANNLPIGAGFVIWNGKYFPPPYTLSGDGDQISLNGNVLPEVAQPFHHISFDGQRSGRVGPMNRRFMFRHMLEANGLLVVDGNQTIVVRPDYTGAFLDTLLADLEDDVKSTNLASQIATSGISADIDWLSFVRTFTPSDELRDRHQAVSHQVDLNAPDESAITSIVNKRTFRYVMTVAGMVFGVFGFGMLLQHQPHIRAHRGEVDQEGPGFQFLPLYVALVFLFGMFDLTCTLFANETGGMLELNPFGDRLLDNPIGISLSKIFVTGLSATILIWLRKYRVAQIASWWLCLICVFLTLRWVTFTSMFLT